MKNKFGKSLVAAALFLLLTAQFTSTVYANAISENNGGTGGDNYSDWDDAWNTVTGKCGDGIDWVLDNSTGTLSLTGSGEMWCRVSHADSFWSASDVKGVTFSGTITSVGAGAFSGGTQLASVTLPRSVKKIGENAFEGCSALKNAEFVNTLESLGKNCFAGCNALADLYFTGSKQDWLFLTQGVQTGISSSVSIHYSSTVSVTSQPSNISAKAGENVKFTIKAQGTGSLKYQWYYRKKGVSAWSIWKAHTTATTSAAANDTWNGMQVYCRIEDSRNYVSSDICVITLLNSVRITAQPADVTLNVGDTAAFTVKAQGSGLKYQWYYKKAGVSSWSIWKAHTTAATSALANDTWDGMQVYCAVSDSAGASANSQPATIKLNGMPKITAQPSDISLKVGDTARFTVKAQGGNLKYQWYYMKNGAKCWSIWKAHTTATTTAVSNSTWNGMQVYCEITDGFGRKVSSKSATIKITK